MARRAEGNEIVLVPAKCASKADVMNLELRGISALLASSPSVPLENVSAESLVRVQTKLNSRAPLPD
jgi:hypothetical protein